MRKEVHSGYGQQGISSPRRFCAPLLGFVLASVLPGCADDKGIPRCVPVVGRVAFNDQPLSAGHLMFLPVDVPNHTTGFEPIAFIDSEGNYSLTTRHKPGAPPGKYRVVVFWNWPGAAEWDPPDSRLPAKYSDHRASPLYVQVVDNPDPGAYDLKMTGTPPARRAKLSK